MIFADKLIHFRENAGWTQVQLARIVGCSNTAICSLESGRNNPSLEMALKLARIFGCTVEDLVSPAPVTTYLENYQYHHRFNNYMCLKESDKKIIDDLIKRLNDA